jgi:hypothetical protein
MAKRARGNVRPGQRRPIERRPATAASAAVPRSVGLTDTEARVAEVEAQRLADEQAAAVEPARRKVPARTTPRVAVTGAGSLAVRAEQEYAYVARDVKRIARIAALLLSVLFALWIVIDVARIVPIG